MKSKEDCYNEATLKSLGNNPQGTRQDVIYLAMEIYAQQFMGMPKMKVERHRLNLVEGELISFTAQLEGIAGMITDGLTEQEAIDELMTSIKVKLLYDLDNKK